VQEKCVEGRTFKSGRGKTVGPVASIFVYRGLIKMPKIRDIRNAIIVKLPPFPSSVYGAILKQKNASHLQNSIFAHLPVKTIWFHPPNPMPLRIFNYFFITLMPLMKQEGCENLISFRYRRIYDIKIEISKKNA
jgi:hypothetical protein